MSRSSTTGKRRWALLALAAAATATLALAAPALAASDGQTGFGFNASEISGFPTGAVSVTGGGAFNLDTSCDHRRQHSRPSVRLLPSRRWD